MAPTQTVKSIPARKARQCAICANPDMTKVVDGMLVRKATDSAILRVLKESGSRMSIIHVQHHRGVCFKARAALMTPPDPSKPKSVVKRDFATLVRDEATRLMEAGELAVTTQHGLMAQQMLDARESKQQDREILLSIARMLTGQEVPQEIVISGASYREIGPGDGGDFDADDLEMIGS